MRRLAQRCVGIRNTYHRFKSSHVISREEISKSYINMWLGNDLKGESYLTKLAAQKKKKNEELAVNIGSIAYRTHNFQLPVFSLDLNRSVKELYDDAEKLFNSDLFSNISSHRKNHSISCIFNFILPSEFKVSGENPASGSCETAQQKVECIVTGFKTNGCIPLAFSVSGQCDKESTEIIKLIQISCGLPSLSMSSLSTASTEVTSKSRKNFADGLITAAPVNSVRNFSALGETSDSICSNNTTDFHSGQNMFGCDYTTTGASAGSATRSVTDAGTLSTKQADSPSSISGAVIVTVEQDVSAMIHYGVVRSGQQLYAEGRSLGMIFH